MANAQGAEASLLGTGVCICQETMSHGHLLTRLQQVDPTQEGSIPQWHC